jgi:hypothetical protein
MYSERQAFSKEIKSIKRNKIKVQGIQSLRERTRNDPLYIIEVFGRD